MLETIISVVIAAILAWIAWMVWGIRFFNEANLSGLVRRLWLVDRGRAPRIIRRKLACNLSAGQTCFRPYNWFFAREIRRGDTISFCLEVHNTSGALIPAAEVWVRNFIPPQLTFIRETGVLHVGAEEPVEVRIPDERFSRQQFGVRFEESGLPELPARTNFTVRYRCRYGRIDTEARAGGLPPVDWSAQADDEDDEIPAI